MYVYFLFEFMYIRTYTQNTLAMYILCNTFAPQIKGNCSNTNLMLHSYPLLWNVVMRSAHFLVLQPNVSLESVLTCDNSLRHFKNCLFL